MSAFHIREATQNDVLGMATVRVDTWRATYKGIVPADLIKNLSYQHVAERWKKTFWDSRKPYVGVFVAEDTQKDIVGITICGQNRARIPSMIARSMCATGFPKTKI